MTTIATNLDVSVCPLTQAPLLFLVVFVSMCSFVSPLYICDVSSLSPSLGFFYCFFFFFWSLFFFCFIYLMHIVHPQPSTFSTCHQTLPATSLILYSNPHFTFSSTCLSLCTFICLHPPLTFISFF